VLDQLLAGFTVQTVPRFVLLLPYLHELGER